MRIGPNSLDFTVLLTIFLRLSDSHVDEHSLRIFLNTTQYYHRSFDGFRESQAKNGQMSSGCVIDVLAPRPGYQGDNTSTPRMARATAKVSLQVTGEKCVNESSEEPRIDGREEGLPLNFGLTWSVMIDGVEEATSTRSLMDLFLPGLDIGQHSLGSRSLMTDFSLIITFVMIAMNLCRVFSNLDQVLLANVKADFVILGDVQILFPPSDYVYKQQIKVRVMLCRHFAAATHKRDGFCADGCCFFCFTDSNAAILCWGLCASRTVILFIQATFHNRPLVASNIVFAAFGVQSYHRI